MRPTLTAVAAALAATALLAACGSSDDTTSTTPMGDTSMDDQMGGDPMEGHGAPSPVMPGARRIEMTAQSLSFDPEEITITAGEDIALVLTAEDMLHDLTVDGLDSHVPAAAGTTEEGGLRADEPGRYTYYCSVPGHREAGMEGTLIVE